MADRYPRWTGHPLSIVITRVENIFEKENSRVGMGYLAQKFRGGGFNRFQTCVTRARRDPVRLSEVKRRRRVFWSATNGAYLTVQFGAVSVPVFSNFLVAICWATI